MVRVAEHRPGWKAAPDTDAIVQAFAPLVEYDEEGRAHGYVFSAPHGRPWPDVLAEAGPALLTAVSAEVGILFDTVSFQAYRDGEAWCDWHNDACDVQVCLSLGAARRVEFEDNKTGEVDGFVVADGDLTVQPLGDQELVRHRVPPDNDVDGARLAVVFRTRSAWG